MGQRVEPQFPTPQDEFRALMTGDSLELKGKTAPLEVVVVS